MTERGGRTMKLRTIATAALAWMIAATGAAGQECEADDEFDCFSLWTSCAPIRSFVSVDDNEAGLQRAAVVDAVESRFRAARIFAPSDTVMRSGALYVSVAFTSAAFRVSFAFFKPGLVRDEYGFQGVAITWEQGSFGTHGGQSPAVMERVRRFIDEFMNDYLRVNGPACEAR